MKYLTKQDYSRCLLIPARGGSKRIPDKNLQEIGDMKLINWAVDNALEMEIDCLISTDSEKIKDEVFEADVILDRPEEFAGDEDRWGWLEYHYSVGELPYDLIGVRQCTTPFLLTATIEKCFELAAYTGKCVSVVGHSMDKIEMKKSGGLYIIHSNMIPSREYLAQGSWLFVSTDHYEAIDIDTEEDLAYARQAYEEMEQNETIYNS